MGFEFKMNGAWFPEEPETFAELQSLAKDESEIWEAICDPQQNHWPNILGQLYDNGAAAYADVLIVTFPKSPSAHWRIAAKLFDASEADLPTVCVAIKEESLRNGTCLETGICRTITLPDGTEMEMIYCPPGNFMMGSPPNEEGSDGYDEMRHRVTLTKGYWLGKYEVTQAQWQSVMRGNPSHFKGYWNPVENVSWEDCQEFFKKVNERLDGGARLPTEAEWEYACRAGSIGAYGGSGLLGDMGWYGANSGRSTHIVGQKRANAWGFFDMHGNVWEWCADWHGDYNGEAIDPMGPSSGYDRVLRGGCWRTDAEGCRSACRARITPGYRDYYYGFRLCCSACPHE